METRTNRGKENKKLEVGELRLATELRFNNNCTYTRSTYNPVTAVYDVYSPDLNPKVQVSRSAIYKRTLYNAPRGNLREVSR